MIPKKLSLTLLALIALELTAVVAAVPSNNSEDLQLHLAEPCNRQKCQLPHCRCSGMSLPLSEFRGKEKEIPQFVEVTFDDGVNAANFAQYEKLFEGLTNPDGCPARGTFFVSHEYTDYSKVNALYAAGHEIALHSVTHGTGTAYWREADVELLVREFGDQIDMLETYAKVNRTHIRGLRLPFLQLSGNNSFVAAKRLGLLYDSSWPTLRYKDPAMWPYTLDYRSMQDCNIGPCPDVSVPGFWINPMVMWNDVGGYSCSMIDGCIYQPKDNVDDIFNWIMDNFNRHYDGNHAPFGMYLHAAWFARYRNSFAAFRMFLQHVNMLPNVYITTASRVIQYMEEPVLGTPFKGCPNKPSAKCRPRSCALRKMSTGEMRYMTVCGSCPEVYPWLGNPMGDM